MAQRINKRPWISRIQYLCTNYDWKDSKNDKYVWLVKVRSQRIPKSLHKEDLSRSRHEQIRSSPLNSKLLWWFKSFFLETSYFSKSQLLNLNLRSHTKYISTQYFPVIVLIVSIRPDKHLGHEVKRWRETRDQLLPREWSPQEEDLDPALTLALWPPPNQEGHTSVQRVRYGIHQWEEERYKGVLGDDELCRELIKEVLGVVAILKTPFNSDSTDSTLPLSDNKVSDPLLPTGRQAWWWLERLSLLPPNVSLPQEPPLLFHHCPLESGPQGRTGHFRGKYMECTK